jgi:hypothetical protein
MRRWKGHLAGRWPPLLQNFSLTRPCCKSYAAYAPHLAVGCLGLHLRVMVYQNSNQHRVTDKIFLDNNWLGRRDSSQFQTAYHHTKTGTMCYTRRMKITRTKKLSYVKQALIMGAFLLLAVSGGLFGYYLLHKDDYSLNSSFANVSNSLSDEELLNIALGRLLEVKNLSYDVTAEGVYQANVKYILGTSPQVSSHTTVTDRGTKDKMTFDTLTKDKSFYFRYTSLPSSVKPDDPQSKYLNQWIAVNEETSKGIGAGSEYLGMFLGAASSMDVPLVIGNVDQKIKDLVQAKIDSGAYKIAKAERTSYNGLAAVKFTLDVDFENASKVFREIYESRNQSPYVPANYTISSMGWGQANAYNRANSSMTLYVSPVNAQMFAIGRTIDTPSFAVFSSRTVTYNNLRFNDVSLPQAPTTTVPFNQYYK